MLAKVLDGRLGADEMARLREMLRDDDKAIDAYVEFMATDTLLQWHFGVTSVAPGDSGAPFGPSLAQGSPTAAASLVVADAIDQSSGQALDGQEAVQGFELPPDESPEEPEPLIAPNIPMPPPLQPASRRPMWWLASAAAVVLVASLAAVLLLRGRSPEDDLARRMPSTAPAPLSPLEASTVTPPATTRPVVVAVLGTSISAAWDDPSFQTTRGTPIVAGQRLGLKRGFAELSFKNGARVVVEGPAALEVESPLAISLESGRLAVNAPKTARGFTVRTPGANLVDLGTDFGVTIDDDGETEVQVFEGVVQAASRAAAATRPSTLKAGDAGRVAKSSVTITPDAANPQAFVRSLTTKATKLNVADLLCGGDGTTRRRGARIDARTSEFRVFGPMATTKPATRPRELRRRAIVDGVFVPNGMSSVDSAGHTFKFPATSGVLRRGVWAGATAPVPSEQEDDQYPTQAGRMGDVDYAGPDHSMLFMNSNAGLTIDLAAVRRLYPGRSITRFQCVVGNPHPPGRERRVESFVLVDGAPRFHRNWRGTGEPPVPLDVPLAEGDRFITLAATDGGDSENHWDWIVWGDPTFHLAAPAAGAEGK